MVGRRLLLASLLSLASASAAQPTPRYAVEPVHPSPLGGLATSVSDAGRVGGVVKTEDPVGQGDPNQAFLWQDGVVVWQGDLGRPDALVLGVDASGVAVGSGLEPAPPYAGQRAGFVRFADGTVATLPAPVPEGASPSSAATDVNADGLAAARIRVADGGEASFHAAVWDTRSDVVVDLGTLGGGFSRADGISDAGRVAGVSRPSGSDMTRAVRWTPDGTGGYTSEDLGTLDGGTFSRGVAIDEASVVFGVADGADGVTRAVLWAPGEPARALPSLDGASGCTARALQSASLQVGRCQVDGEQVAVVWIDGVLFRLGDQLVDDGWRVTDARGVNADGWIVGSGELDGLVDSDGNPAPQPVLLRPIDPTGSEPAAPRAALRLAAAPNPFGPLGTHLTVTLAAPADVRAEVFDVRGRRVRTLVDGPHDGGPYRVDWDGRDEGGQPVAAGVYLVRVRSDAEVATLVVSVVR